MRLRFSIRRLMLLVLYIAVGLAAVTAGAFPFAVVTLSATTLGVLLSRGPSRAFLLGCSVFGWTALLLAFGIDPRARNELPTTRLIIHIYEKINGPGPSAFNSPEEAHRWIIQLVESLNRALTMGYSLIALSLALTGGSLMWLIASLWKRLAARIHRPPPTVSPIA